MHKSFTARRRNANPSVMPAGVVNLQAGKSGTVEQENGKIGHICS